MYSDLRFYLLLRRERSRNGETLTAVSGDTFSPIYSSPVPPYFKCWTSKQP